MAQKPETQVALSGSPDAIRFHYIKSAYFRTIHVDGAFGGISPAGYIHAGLYNDRRAIPRITEQKILPNGMLGKEERVPTPEDKEGIAREVEVDLILDAGAARRIGQWLIDRADEYDQAIAAASPPGVKP